MSHTNNRINKSGASRWCSIICSILAGMSWSIPSKKRIKKHLLHQKNHSKLRHSLLLHADFVSNTFWYLPEKHLFISPASCLHPQDSVWSENIWRRKNNMKKRTLQFSCKRISQWPGKIKLPMCQWLYLPWMLHFHLLQRMLCFFSRANGKG